MGAKGGRKKEEVCGGVIIYVRRFFLTAKLRLTAVSP